MAIGKRNPEQQRELWLATQDLAAGPGHIFYDKLNQLLAEGQVRQIRRTVVRTVLRPTRTAFHPAGG